MCKECVDAPFSTPHRRSSSSCTIITLPPRSVSYTPTVPGLESHRDTHHMQTPPLTQSTPGLPRKHDQPHDSNPPSDVLPRSLSFSPLHIPTPHRPHFPPYRRDSTPTLSTRHISQSYHPFAPSSPWPRPSTSRAAASSVPYPPASPATARAVQCTRPPASSMPRPSANATASAAPCTIPPSRRVAPCPGCMPGRTPRWASPWGRPRAAPPQFPGGSAHARPWHARRARRPCTATRACGTCPP